MGEPWFRPKPFGIGAGWPIRWQGWVALVAYVASVVLAIQVVFALDSDVERAVLLVAALVVPTTIFVLIARAKTEGGWRWRS